MNKKAFITGINGQDGSYLAEYLLEKDYKVYGIVRRNSVSEHQQSRLENIIKHINVDYGDVTDYPSLVKLITLIKPDEVYNLAAQSHVRISFEIPNYTGEVNALGVLNVLEVIRQSHPAARLYQASSSEMFGNSVDDDGYQRESTPMHPVSPYGCAKLYGYSIIRNYRKSYGLFASNGILFNHESPRRGSNFVTTKIIKTAVMIKLGMCDKLELGNMNSYRDWGHSKDYVRAMHLILNHTVADDFVVATGDCHSVNDLCGLVFKKLGLDLKHIVQNDKYVRPEELKYLRGDSKKIRTTLGWTPTYTFESMLDEMIENWLNHFKHKCNF